MQDGLLNGPFLPIQPLQSDDGLVRDKGRSIGLICSQWGRFNTDLWLDKRALCLIRGQFATGPIGLAFILSSSQLSKEKSRAVQCAHTGAYPVTWSLLYLPLTGSQLHSDRHADRFSSET